MQEERKDQEKQGVVSLSKYREGLSAIENKQEGMRAAARDFAAQKGYEMPIAGLYVAVRPNGELVSLAMNIEPEHVQPIIAELRRMMDEMRAFELLAHG